MTQCSVVWTDTNDSEEPTEDEGSRLLCNHGTYLPDYVVSYHRSITRTSNLTIHFVLILRLAHSIPQWNEMLQVHLSEHTTHHHDQPKV
jgi:hypothetical protein